MNRPRTVIASITVMTIYCVFLAIGMIGISAASSLSLSTKLGGIVIMIFLLILGLLDIIFLVIRKRWVYFYNLILYFIATLALLNTALFAISAKHASTLFAPGIAGLAIYGVPAILQAWLCIALIIKRDEVFQYFMADKKALLETAGEPVGPSFGNSFGPNYGAEVVDNPREIYAGFWCRLLANLIDYLALSIGQMFFLLILLLMRVDLKVFNAIPYLGAYIIYLPTVWLYFTLFESSARMATLGKLALDIIVNDSEYRRITFSRANGRFWSKALSLFSLLIGFIMIAFTKRKQGLHDLIARTVVIKRSMMVHTKQ
jgi:uncharacterized RDD family membrane protein YckC